MPDTPEAPTPSPQLLRSQAVARDIEAVLGRTERKLDRLDMPTARAAADLRAEVAGGASDLRNEARGYGVRSGEPAVRPAG